MFLLNRPDASAIERFVRKSKDLPLSYAPIGLVEAPTRRHSVDEVVIAIGRGTLDFDRARAALAAWKHFELGWVELVPRHAAPDPGTTVAVLIRHLGFWSLNGARVVYTVDGDAPRFGFAYGTLANHAESGEELFEVFRNRETDEVCYRIRAVSSPRAALARLAYPITRLLQARFRRDSARAMQRALVDRTDGGRR